MSNPETGFRDVETEALVGNNLHHLGFEAEAGLAITSVKAIQNGHNDGPILVLIGELHRLCISVHLFTGSTSGVAHACGHNAQIAEMLDIVHDR